MGKARDGDKPETSESELLLFGGPLRYDMGWSQHANAFLELNFRAMVRRLPSLLASSFRLAWQADRWAARTVLASETGRGLAQAVSLLAMNSILARLIADGTVEQRLRGAAPALVAIAAVMLVSTLLRAASTYATGRLEPKVERVATELYLERAAAVELSAIEDDGFHKLLDTAKYGAQSARRMISYSAHVVNALISLIAAAGVLTVLHPALLPLLVTMTLPSAWSALTIARRRYTSFHAWVQHARAGYLIGSLLIEPEAAPEIRVHGVGPFLLRHFRSMSETAEAEQARLARLAARTGLYAALWTGLATVATYATLGGLLLAGAMALSVAGTAVIAIRTGSASLDTLVLEVNSLHEEALFVGDMQRLYVEAAKRAIPEGGDALPEDPREIRLENVTFTYPGKAARPALSDVTLTVPLGKIVALVGENGSGKTTLVKLLAGLYAPDQGKIMWDGVDAAGADRRRLAERIAMVAQDFKRWPFTARVNLAIGRPSAPLTEERLAAAVAEAGAQDVLEDLPRGLDTLLGRGFSGGHELSGGQWQRLGIARAAYRRGRILIVDEPTAALDARAELEVFEKIRALAGTGQTVVLITHRLASVRHADLVHVLDQGRLVESGTPEELLATGGVYAELYSLQAEQFAAKVPAPARVPTTAPATAPEPAPTGASSAKAASPEPG
ncbi:MULTISPECIES: ABC transporter ATP-binding protein [Streptomyces]|uniref:ATP-binding cassette subfamily B protein n=1 Tax=Streptomyces stelliscabiei TaxID=146820 RepID=A0A8I0TSI5_9ACTN|nr:MULTISPECIES: ABC transporter ATP-binding protein [Streptomyces]KND41432.1 ABC transporter [Streptomyces stelliscabiei]MBE1596288.1 ATP-binding cassette subfamily B protein [Streptomyces stelliscabiei]MDX2518102.1 ABC transporter ATP-binding protein [Streptomyces stelliscabiei]MDX2555722.1 ABC transporter ATP-binding protein [Streptomyces stelliscabiei]MDX2614291.1 ABC transporter ATP-binding protein [Streptomyces stelliscabiei]